MISRYLTKVFCFFVFCLPADLFGQTNVDTIHADGKSLFEIFENKEIPEIVIVADFDSLKSNKKTKNYHFGSFELLQGRNSVLKLDVKLRARGKSRRMMCDFPPLKLKFSKDDLKANGLEPFNDFKLVTHCRQDDPVAVTLVMREYLIYQMFNQLTPYSFKAKLVHITYKNTGASFRKTKQLGIIIEDAESLAARNGCQTMEQKVISLDSLHRNQERINSVFQYMIGNADWSYMMARNTELIQQPDGQIVPVPYDFDYAGMVKAPYARANAALGQASVLDRVFLGISKTPIELNPIFSYFKKKRPELEKTVDSFEELDRESRLEMLAYLEEFFNIINTKERVELEMLGRNQR